MEKKNKLVVYTSIFGQYEGLIPQQKYKDIDFVCFSDSDIKSSRWKVIKVDKPFDDNTRSARYFKVLAHRHLKEYETSVYIDANFLILKNPQPLAGKILEDSLIAFFDHNQTTFDARNCVYKEYEALVEWGKEIGKYKDDEEIMRKQVDLMKGEGYPTDYGLISSGVLIRRHNHPEIIELMEAWWNMIKSYSKRDQLSFNYVMWKTGFEKYRILEGDIRYGNDWFYFLGHHKKSYFTKLLKFRIRRLWRILKMNKDS